MAFLAGQHLAVAALDLGSPLSRDLVSLGDRHVVEAGEQLSGHVGAFFG
ncbi:MAG: hypothetical protein M3O15_03590 [Acidobacteriota bacterium]|nr:hypothetical protein [Acidobacteriota bacterium]